MDTSDSATIIPTRYDLREKGRAAAVRNRGTFGTCWAFAALGGTGVVVAAGRETAVFGRPYDDEQWIYTDAG